MIFADLQSHSPPSHPSPSVLECVRAYLEPFPVDVVVQVADVDGVRHLVAAAERLTPRLAEGPLSAGGPHRTADDRPGTHWTPAVGRTWRGGNGEWEEINEKKEEREEKKQQQKKKRKETKRKIIK